MNSRETILSCVQRFSDRVFLIDIGTGRETTYRDFHRRVCALAAEARARGVCKGDRVAVMMPNCCELAVLYFACIYLGAVIVPLNPTLSKSEVQFILASCKPALIIGGAAHVDLLREFHQNVIALLTEKDTSGASKGAGALHLSVLDEIPNFVPLENAGPEELVVIMYTSGTSAKPKGLAHKLSRMLRNATAFAAVQGIDHNSRFYLTLSMAYMGGFYNLLVLPFLCGASVVVDHVFDARSSLNFWDKAKIHKANTLWMSPTVLSILLRMDRGRTGEEFCRSSVRHAFVGFAPLPLKVKNEFEGRYGVHLIENYGLSETLFVTARSRETLPVSGYVGEPLAGLQLRIINDVGRPTPPGQDGEIQILTPDLMAGYLDSEGRLLEIDSADWFSAGDVGHLDSQGSLSITGRKKDLIIRGGINISPAAVEEVLAQVSGISEAAVVSIPHELYGEDIVAVVKLETGIELDSILDSVVNYAKRNLAPHQQPARYIAIDEFPRTANGKIQKTRIRELVTEKLQLSVAGPGRRPSMEGAGVHR
ncbi:MAG TPA: class I adenylate-forming enzyme family protein [Candidatus Sulfotelmatobacter sp.]